MAGAAKGSRRLNLRSLGAVSIQGEPAVIVFMMRVSADGAAARVHSFARPADYASQLSAQRKLRSCRWPMIRGIFVSSHR